jgi:hypothetical protein
MISPKIKYVAIEILKKGCSNAVSVERGLFKGIKMRSDNDPSTPKISSFLLIEKTGEEASLHGFNLDKFNILSINHRYDDTKELIVYKANEPDQKKALALLESFANILSKDKRMVKNDPEIIDVATYTDIPGEIKKTKTVHQTKNIYNVNGCHYNKNNITDWEKKRREKEAEEKRQEDLRKIPTVFKREGETPGTKSLNLMKKKVLAIATGDYESDILPGKEEEDEEDDDLGYNSGFVAG